MAVFRLCVPLHAHMHTEIMELETIIKVFYYSRATFPPKAPLLHNLFMEEPANPASAQTQIHAHTHNQTHTETSVSCLSSHWNHLENNPCFSGKCLHRGLLVMAVESTSCGFVFVPYTHIRTHAHTNTFSLGCICTRS